MKYFIRGVLSVALLVLIYFFVSEYIVEASVKSEQIAYEENIEQNSNLYIANTINNEASENEDKIDIYSLLENYKKFTTEYQTAKGEKYTIIGSLKIPKINIEYDILSSTSDDLLNLSLNRYWGSGPNEVGNMCVVGHNYNDSKFFANLNKLKIGDKIEITDSCGRTLNYYAYDKFVVDPYDTRCTSQLTDGQKEITLITCYNVGKQRLIIKARAEENENTNLMSNIIENIYKNIE